MNNIAVLATGRCLMSGKVRSFDSAVEELLNESKSELHLLIYSFTELRVLRSLEKAVERGIKLKMIVNKQDRPDIKKRLQKMTKKSNCSIIWFPATEYRQLHAKVLVGDRNIAIVGSANLSRRGMISNYEIGLLVSGKPAWELAKSIDNLGNEIEENPAKI